MATASKKSFRQLSVVQARFADAYLGRPSHLLGARIIRDADPPYIEVEHSGDVTSSELGLPHSFEGVEIKARPGKPGVVAV